MSLQSAEQILQGSTLLAKDFADTANGGAKELAELSHMSSLLLQHLHSGQTAPEELLDRARNMCFNSVGIQAFTVQAVLKSIVAMVDEKQQEGTTSLETTAEDDGEYHAVTPPRSIDEKNSVAGKSEDKRLKRSMSRKSGNIIETPKTAKEPLKWGESIQALESDDEAREQSAKQPKKRKTRSMISYQESNDEEIDEKPEKTPKTRKTGQQSIAAKERDFKRRSEGPLSKTAERFGLKGNQIKCPHCDEWQLTNTIDNHIKTQHNKEEGLKLFGCRTCNAWYKSLVSAAFAHKDCPPLCVRSKEEALQSMKQVEKLSMLSQLFDAKDNKIKCPYCEERHSTSRMDIHLGTHPKEGRLKFFGCRTCNAWYTHLGNAAVYHKECQKLCVRTKEEVLEELQATIHSM